MLSQTLLNTLGENYVFNDLSKLSSSNVLNKRKSLWVSKQILHYLLMYSNHKKYCLEGVCSVL